MNLWVNNKPARVYIPPNNPKQTYKKLQAKINAQGSIPIGIDHLPNQIIKDNPILAKLDLLHVGEITEINYSNDAITIAEAQITNPLIQELYENGELEMVSIVANSTVKKCPRDEYDYIVENTDINRVDIVEKGACTTCHIPKPQENNDTVVYARYTIIEEDKDMSNDNITKEDIKQIFDECIEAKLAPINEQINTIIEDKKNTESNNEDEKVKEMTAKIAELKKESATAKVDNFISQGKIIPAKKDTMVELCASNPETFDELMKDAPVLIDLEGRTSIKASETDPDDDEDKPLTAEEENLNNILNHFTGE